MLGVAKGFISLIILTFLTYISVATAHIAAWADILAVILGFVAAGTIFFTVFSSENKTFQMNFLLVGVAILTWTLSNLLLFCNSRHILNLHNSENAIIVTTSFGTNLFFVATVLYYILTRLQKWNSVQLIVDSVSFSLGIFWLFWSILYNKQLSSIPLIHNDNIFDTISISMNIFLVVITGTWYMSIRNGNIPLPLRFLIGTITFYAFTNMLFFYQPVQDNALLQNILNTIYTVIIFVIALSTQLFYIQYPTNYDNPKPSTNIGDRQRGLFLLLCPLIIFLVRGYNLTDFLFYLFLVPSHSYASYYIQRSITAKALLDQEYDMNKRLEQLVSEQTKNLKVVNTELRRRNTEMQHINYHDALTGIYNRVYFIERLEEMIRNATDDESVVLVLWNIDKLKSINGTYGYSMGDKLLSWHARQAKLHFPAEGILARLGSDEFAYTIKGHYQADDLLPIAAHALDACKEPLCVGEYVFNITASVGVSAFPSSASNAVALLKNADIAMRHVKARSGDPRISRYYDIDEAVKRKMLIASRLKTAQYDQELSLHFQPQFRLWDNRLIGMEALLRWNCPDLGPVSPAEFIPIAEAENLIIPIGRWVMENAIRQIAAWNTACGSNLRMGINISPRQLGQMGTLEELREIVTRYQAQYGWIDIEITESVALDSENDAEKIKEYFKSSDISISIDDFGTGYSSLGYLSILSFDRLKIAKPLIDKITYDESSRKIIMSIVLLAKSLGLETISEGVETEEQYNLLRELGCDQIQGFYLGRPVPASIFENAYLNPLDQPKENII